ncbi:histone deacetylase family protein [Phaeobacter gallaeciensis]|jgi:acetoin utilization deacetylase AcuC-like enzyme|uniref:histone deacetylase family protein n=1 Tax=Phaeobacter gallaeciensis TaxID=60890 RepID=UPI00237F66C2|nr:histone deacetylase family protein [Phaeobacter gallaeciensis]MDE4306200.1 histone deacetylase family protein [Phaeobacter gallaeciensis]MDE4310666.1 histone deacetylase family protein [Phaeobacter gallaeciensis]MDE4314656.1 histone deacetylase family protein [Phaeobacter gallaeciensis]MDE4319594.1 histone deacetylase family protein [Phaeobacter gallaeciensis]MDE4324022.1 histone deacetylase family protein [Phaeobacter gallaeciensis]
MQCFYAPETDLHDPIFRLTNGKIQRNAERAERARLLMAGLDQLGLSTETPPEAPRSTLEAVHTEKFLAFLETAWEEWQKLPDCGPEVVPQVFPKSEVATYPENIVARAGWHFGDTSAPIGEHSWTASRRAADCAVAAADVVLGGAPSAYALCRPAGHHTSADIAAGHCLMNNSAIAAARLRTEHARVATLDIDVHHGNGTQEIFYDRADVMTCSVHADPSDYYPFNVGHAHETGRGEGLGFNLNIPLPRTTTDEAWLEAIAASLEAIAAFQPGALMVSLGLDAHENDPLLGMKVSFDGFRRAGEMIAAAGYPTVLVQEGGYLSPDLTTSLASFLSGFLGREG